MKRPDRTGVLPMTELELPADFRAFHEHYRRKYLAWAELYLRNRRDAEEAVDAAFEEIYLKWDKLLRHENPTAYAWLIAKHRTKDYERARRGRESTIDCAAFETRAVRHAVDPIGELEVSLALYEAIRALPERQHDVIVMQFCLGYGTSETADLLGITPAGVRSTARYAKHRLREALGLDHEDHDDNEESADDRAH